MVKLTSTRQWDGGYLELGGGKVGGDVVKGGTDFDCRMSTSWGGVCSTLMLGNPILLPHAGNLSESPFISVSTTHRTWAFGGDGCVGSWIVINISKGTGVT